MVTDSKGAKVAQVTLPNTQDSFKEFFHQFEEPTAPVSSYSSGGVYRCKRDYDAALGRICLNIEKRYIDEPLTTEVLRQLDSRPAYVADGRKLRKRRRRRSLLQGLLSQK